MLPWCGRADFTFVFPDPHFLGFCVPQRHGDRRPSTTACQGCWAMGTNKVKKYAVGKIICVLGWLEQPRAGTKIYCTGTTRPTNQPRKNPFHMYSKSPHLPQFQQSAGASPLWSLWAALSTNLSQLHIGSYCFSYAWHELVKEYTNQPPE
jgi:hypothetical protein